jgi:hypothetical protein
MISAKDLTIGIILLDLCDQDKQSSRSRIITIKCLMPAYDERDRHFEQKAREWNVHELVRLDARSAWRQFQAMVREAQQEAGIWRSNDQ